MFHGINCLLPTGKKRLGYRNTYVAPTLTFEFYMLKQSWGSACKVGKNESEPVERWEVVWFTANAHAGILKALATV